MPNVPTRLNGERIPGIALPRDPGEDVTKIKEGEPFRSVGFSEEYIETPATDKHGVIIPVTKEAVFFDRTGLVLERAKTVGELLGLQKEKRLLGLVMGAVNPYREKRYGDLAPVNLKTFYAADDTARWTNHFDGNPLERLHEHRLWRPAVRQYGRSEYGRADHPRQAVRAGPGADPAADRADRHGDEPLEVDEHADQWAGSANFPSVGTIGRNLIADVGYATSASFTPSSRRSLASIARRHKATGSMATSPRPLPIWKTGRSRLCRRPRPPVILSNQPNATLVYTALLTFPDQWDPLFTQAFVAALASQLALPVLEDKKFALQMRAQQIAIAKQALDQARISDGNETWSSVDHIPDWIRKRNAGFRWGAWGPWNGPGQLWGGWDSYSFGDGSAY